MAAAAVGGCDLTRASRRSVPDRNRDPYSHRMSPQSDTPHDRHMTDSMRTAWAAVVAGILLVTMLAGPRPAAADEPGESTVASELVRQAIALIVNTPGDMEAIEDKIGDALEVDDQEGVDVALVRQAAEALEAGDLHEARSLLEGSIGARSHLGGTDVAPIGEVSEDHVARGAEAGDAPILDPLDTGGVDGGDLIAIGVGVVLVLAGGDLGLRWRPSRVKEA